MKRNVCAYLDVVMLYAATDFVRLPFSPSSYSHVCAVAGSVMAAYFHVTASTRTFNEEP